MNDITQITKPIFAKYGVKKAALFGSYAQGNQDENSDIDIIIEPPSNMGLSFVTLQQELEEKLNKAVDLVSFNGISKHLEKYILSSLKPIL